MLILSRKLNESVVIGNNIKIQILEIKDGQVKLGFDAKSDIRIYRSEIVEEIEKQNKIASKSKRETVASAAKILKKKI